MKSAFHIDDVPQLIKEVSNSPGWVLCVGAGISLPIFPLWKDLVLKIINEITPTADKFSSDLIKNYNPDALIQAAYNLGSFDNSKFSSLLIEKLYSNLKSLLNDKEWSLYCKATSVTSPGALNRDEWFSLYQALKREYKGETLLPLAQKIHSVVNTEFEPKAILSFNVEPTFLLLLNSILLKSKNPPKGYSAIKQFDIVTRSLSTQHKDRIPFIYCHGFLPPSDKVQKLELIANEKLVFSEKDYLQLTKSNYSWQSSTFLHHCSQSRILFIGLSLTDPNIRRWLSWVQSNKEEEIYHVHGSKPDSTSHYWIEKRPKDEDHAKWIEATVAHLGVRIIWLNDWGEIEKVLNKLF